MTWTTLEINEADALMRNILKKFTLTYVNIIKQNEPNYDRKKATENARVCNTACTYLESANIFSNLRCRTSVSVSSIPNNVRIEDERLKKGYELITGGIDAVIANIAEMNSGSYNFTGANQISEAYQNAKKTLSGMNPVPLKNGK